MHVGNESSKEETGQIALLSSANHRLNVLKDGGLEYFASKPESSFKLLRNPDCPVLHDILINDDKPVILRSFHVLEDPDRKAGTIKFIL